MRRCYHLTELGKLNLQQESVPWWSDHVRYTSDIKNASLTLCKSTRRGRVTGGLERDASENRWGHRYLEATQLK